MGTRHPKSSILLLTVLYAGPITLSQQQLFLPGSPFWLVKRWRCQIDPPSNPTAPTSVTGRVQNETPPSAGSPHEPVPSQSSTRHPPPSWTLPLLCQAALQSRSRRWYQTDLSRTPLPHAEGCSLYSPYPTPAEVRWPRAHLPPADRLSPGPLSTARLLKFSSDHVPPV